MSIKLKGARKVRGQRRVSSARTGVKDKGKTSFKPSLLQTDPTTTRDNTRKRLLKAIQHHRPDVLSSLATNVLPLYSKFYRPGAKQHHLMHWWQLRDKNDKEGNRRRAASGGEATPLLQLERTLWRWADSYNLKEEWFLDHALQTLSLWCRHSRGVHLDWAYKLQGPRYVAVDVPSKFRFECDPWNPKADTWRSYKGKLTEEFKEASKAYRKTITATFHSRKQTAAREKLEETHFQWIIDYQIPANGKTKTMSEIARGATTSGGVDPATVNEAIKSLASLVDWELLPSKRGRPRKPKPPSDS